MAVHSRPSLSAIPTPSLGVRTRGERLEGVVGRPSVTSVSRMPERDKLVEVGFPPSPPPLEDQNQSLFPSASSIAVRVIVRVARQTKPHSGNQNTWWLRHPPQTLTKTTPLARRRYHNGCGWMAMIRREYGSSVPGDYSGESTCISIQGARSLNDRVVEQSLAHVLSTRKAQASLPTTSAKCGRFREFPASQGPSMLFVQVGSSVNCCELNVGREVDL